MAEDDRTRLEDDPPPLKGPTLRYDRVLRPGAERPTVHYDQVLSETTPPDVTAVDVDVDSTRWEETSASPTRVDDATRWDDDPAPSHDDDATRFEDGDDPAPLPDDDATRFEDGDDPAPSPDDDATLLGDAPQSSAATPVDGATHWDSPAVPAGPSADNPATYWSEDGDASASPTAAPSFRPKPGAVLGAYELLQELGRGGMGVVYRARETATGRDVALKLILGATLSEARKARFLREGQLTAALRHPGVVQIFGAGEVHGVPYLACELVVGARSLLQASPDREERVRMIRDAAEALGYAHQEEIVHRDVKPDNLLVDAEGRVRVADFGLALGQDVERLTRTGAALGTPAFMAPEQVAGQRAAQGPPTDVWALGVMLYEVLTGVRPFIGLSLQEIYRRIQTETPKRPSAVDATVSVQLDRICLQALQRDPEKRYSDGRALAADLDRYVSGEPVEAQPLGRRWPALLAVSLLLMVLSAAWAFRPQTAADATPEVATRPKLDVSAPSGELLSTLDSVTVRGVVTGSAPSFEVWVGAGERTRVARGVPFSIEVPLAPGRTLLKIQAEGPAGLKARPVRRTVIRPSRPAWFERLAPSVRPALPLPDGLKISPRTKEYIWSRDGSVLVWVPPATFMLGQAANNFRLYSPNARTEHFEFPRREIEVTLTQGYFIGKFEVKVSQYRAYASETKTRLPSLYLNALYVLPVGMEAELETRHGEGVPFDPTGDHPMFSLTWNEAKRYCRWAGLRLPREAEWELAARGTDGRAFPWGNVPPDTTGTNFLNWLNTNDGEYYVAPVGRYPSGASPYGCMDMAGNVQEPVQDWIGAYPTGPLRDPTGPAKPGPVRKRVYRGGHYMILLPPGLHTAARWSRNPKSRGAGCGIRVALSHPKSE